MSKEHRTTEFSAHISRSKMRRYLHDQLKAHDNAEVETHLKHCERCSQAIIQYIEEEEPENYKNHIKKLKGIIIETVQPKGPRFSPVQVKSMRAAAAVVILFAFSFFAFESLIEKDFNLVAKPEKKEENFKRNNVFPEDVQKKKTTKVAATQEELKTEPKIEKVAEAKVAEVVPKKKTVKKPEPKVEAAKVAKAETPKKKEVKVQPKPVQVVSETPQVADNTAKEAETEAEEVKKTEELNTEEKTDPVAQVEKEDTKEEQNELKPVAPIQKLEKVNLNEEANELTKEKPVQVVPSASVGQLRQRE